MIYEVKTTDIKPQRVAEAEKLFAEAYEYRRKYSELAVFWHTELGPLNQIIEVWPYADHAERARVQAAVARDANWPPKIRHLIMSERTEIMVPLSISPEIKPGKQGPFFEYRTYTIAPGELTNLINLWEQAIPKSPRTRISPLCAAWYCEVGGLNRFVHIWGYPSLNHRVDIRKQAAATGFWPPSAYARQVGMPMYELVAQESKIVMPSAFSPLQ